MWGQGYRLGSGAVQRKQGKGVRERRYCTHFVFTCEKFIAEMMFSR